ncbi:phosphonate metabolism protein/1,5-bisphosphokinase (PRPP-forming) PhnN [Devosia sp. SL43]|uniref:phosphonate metabolism protein/1,5-bisphosphokinase (PRPP-forming) PhnN n=1 Tax=Devosia sp. SL43 TaxID=2806348 RepID=UPI001EFFE6AE|nr:phosphonate metabolism protein/1,5-bisphosphokinase (PRPP-forming) PhnN [Devosia sp. SL43]UJW85400.1 phosphonate metabolism protein/1,5-bisphosphokinase (PRPP-forming) PhnN [Devosia sp. SL43]
MSGTFVAVVGPSGVGKDSLIGFARERLEASGRVTFVRRVVTRQADGGSEDHDSMDVASFAAAEQDGAFALNWDAHGLRYGLPIGLEDDLKAGRVVVANLSRAVIPALVERYPDAVVVLVTAERDVIERRLSNRGRETAESIQGRLDRRVGDKLPARTVKIDNSGALEAAGTQFVRLLGDAARMGVRA